AAELVEVAAFTGNPVMQVASTGSATECRSAATECFTTEAGCFTTKAVEPATEADEPAAELVEVAAITGNAVMQVASTGGS
ncbi:MAG: hypothetical protein LBS86_03190, partial [Treponema sp.]|nr:hypothetical protein [Treponema sp.]